MMAQKPPGMRQINCNISKEFPWQGGTSKCPFWIYSCLEALCAAVILWPQLNYLTLSTENCLSKGSSKIILIPESVLYYCEASWPLVVNLWHKGIFSRKHGQSFNVFSTAGLTDHHVETNL